MEDEKICGKCKDYEGIPELNNLRGYCGLPEAQVYKQGEAFTNGSRKVVGHNDTACEVFEPREGV